MNNNIDKEEIYDLKGAIKDLIPKQFINHPRTTTGELYQLDGQQFPGYDKKIMIMKTDKVKDYHITCNDNPNDN